MNNPAFAYREIEDSDHVINRNDGEEYAPCPECGKMIFASYLDENDMCRDCFDQKHSCAYCGYMAEKELPKSRDGYRYCDSCYREQVEFRVGEVRELVQDLIMQLQVAPTTAEETALKFCRESGIQKYERYPYELGVMIAMVSRMSGAAELILKDLEAI